MFIPKIISSVSEKLDVCKSLVEEVYYEYQPRIKELSGEGLEQELSRMANDLYTPLSSAVYLGDFHGHFHKFINYLTRRFGFLGVKIDEKLTGLTRDQKNKLEYIIRTGELPENYEKALSKKQIIDSMIKLLKARAGSLKQYDYIRAYAPSHLKTNIMNLLYCCLSPLEENRIFNDDKVFLQYVDALAELNRNIVLGIHGKIYSLGDIFDRGDDPDKIIKELIKYKQVVKNIWGNHDVLWMGAVAGHPSLIMEALRISVRYNNVDFLERIGIDLTKLKEFAYSTYGSDRPAFNSKNKNDLAAVLEKALYVIQSKFEQEAILRNPEFKMNSRIYLPQLAEALKNNHDYIEINGEKHFLQDVNFPTLDLDDPTKLNGAELGVVDDLIKQFTSSEKLKKLMQYMFESGRMSYAERGILAIHASIPSNEQGELEQLEAFEGLKGKELFDYMETFFKEVGRKYIAGEKINIKDLDKFFYSWCGKGSPLFDKDKMATWERYYIKGVSEKEGIGKETSQYWTKNMENPEFRKKVFANFGSKMEKLDTLIQGHTPKDPSELKNFIKANGEWIYADVGWIDKKPGHPVIDTSKDMYVAIGKLSKEDMEQFEQKYGKNSIIEFTYQVIKRRERQRNFADIGSSNKTKVLYELILLEQQIRNMQAV